MEILHFKEFGDTVNVIMSLGVYLVFNNFVYAASDTLPLYQILKQLDN